MNGEIGEHCLRRADIHALRGTSVRLGKALLSEVAGTLASLEPLSLEEETASEDVVPIVVFVRKSHPARSPVFPDHAFRPPGLGAFRNAPRDAGG